MVRGSRFWEEHLKFRDYLRAHPEVAREYFEVKTRLAEKCQNGVDYTEGKSPFIRTILNQVGSMSSSPKGAA